MIERLQRGEFRESVLASKINELVDSVNNFHAKLDPLAALMHDDGTVTWAHDFKVDDEGTYIREDE